MHQLLKNIDHLIEAPNGIDKLRQTVLQLAVQGKLTSEWRESIYRSHPELVEGSVKSVILEDGALYEPVSELQKKIKAEKEKLIAEGKIKKQPELAPINEDEKPFELPQTWLWERLGNLGEIFNGNSINEQVKASKYKGVKEGHDYIGTKDVDFRSPKLKYENGVRIPFNESNFRIAHKGSVLICAEGGSAGRKVGIVEKDICFGNKLFVIEPYIQMPQNFIYSVYRSIFFYEQFSSKMTGIIGGVSSNNFKNLLFSLPPLAEQHRIVEKVNEFMKIIDELEKKKEARDNNKIALNNSSIDKLLNSKTYEEQKQNWKTINTSFSTLYSVKENVEKLKQTILQLAVQGKLTSEWRESIYRSHPGLVEGSIKAVTLADGSIYEPASELLKKIKAEKAMLLAEGKIKKQSELSPIKENDKPFELPKGWEWVTLQEISIKIGDGDHNTPPRETKGYYLLSARNVTNEGIKLYDVDYVNKDVFEKLREKCNPDKDDILISCSGSVGRIALVDEDNKYVMVRSAAFLKPVKEFLSSQYLVYILRSPFIQEQIIRKSRSTAQSNLFLGQINKILIALPPLFEQRRIVEKVRELMSLCNKLEQNITLQTQEQERLVNSLVSKININ